MRRLALALLLIVAVLFGARGAPALEPAGSASASSNGGVPAQVRTGVTELAGPSAKLTEPPPVADPDSETLAPGDAPRASTNLKLPAVPKGFITFDAGWIVFSYHPSSRQRVEPLIFEAEEVRRDLEHRLGQQVLKRVRVDVARTPGEMEGLAPEGAPYPEYAAGVAYPELGLILLTLTPRYAEADHDVSEIFKHELAHVALNDAVAGKSVPRWFNEGFAVLASGEVSTKRLWTLWRSTLADSLLPFKAMERRFPDDEANAEVAYAQAVDLVRYLIRDQDEHRFVALIRELRGGASMDAAVLEAYSVDLPLLEQEWQKDVAKRYTFWPILCSGTVIWGGILGLSVYSWRLRRRRAKATLDRWAKEEAAEDAARARRASEPRIHIVLARAPEAAPVMPDMPALPENPEVPKVQHEGQWHTLH